MVRFQQNTTVRLCLVCATLLAMLHCQSVNAASRRWNEDDAESESTEDPEDDFDDLDALFDESLESLAATRVAAPEMAAEVTSVARSETPVGKTPAAIFVITNDMIHRSGARTLPDVLRMVPGLHVARMANGTWSVGMRGNSSVSTNDLLVQVDGRSIYSRFFGGTLWGAQDFLLEDIDRIEVIRGPGGTVWGANAVRGVINIVTKCSCQTQGLFAEFGAGDQLQRTASVRYGGRTEYGHYRIWGRDLKIDGGEFADGPDPWFWGISTAGFRADLTETFFDRLTIDAGLMESQSITRFSVGQATPPFATDTPVTSKNSSWYTNVTGEYEVAENESIMVRGSFFSSELDGRISSFSPMNQTEFDFQHNLKPAENHSVVWGLNYRRTTIDVGSTFFLTALSNPFMLNEYGLFLQDTISFSEQLALTVGTKLSYNDLSGLEHQPSARLVYNPDPKTALWASVSRAVRSPNFSNTQAQLRVIPTTTTPVAVFPVITGADVASEDMFAVEVGIRQQPSEDFFWDLSAYHFTFRDSVAIVPNGGLQPSFPGSFDLPLSLENIGGTQEVAGFEWFSRYQVSDSWKLSGNYTFAYPMDDASQFPRNMAYVQSSHQLGHDVELDMTWRYVDNFSDVNAYNTADVRVAWQYSKHLEFSLIGQNLLRPSQFEEAALPTAGSIPSANQRSIFGLVQLRY